MTFRNIYTTTRSVSLYNGERVYYSIKHITDMGEENANRSD